MTLFLRICINSSIRQFNYSRHRHANTIYRVPTNLLFSRRDRTDLKSHCFGSIDCIPTTYIIFNTHSSPKETIHILPAHCQFVFPIIKTNGVNFLYANTHTKKKGGSHSGGVTYFGCTRRSTRSDRVLNLGRSACLVCPMYNADTPSTHSYNRTLILASQHTIGGSKDAVAKPTRSRSGLQTPPCHEKPGCPHPWSRLLKYWHGWGWVAQKRF